MTATNHTEHYELSQYTEADRPTYTGDYNTDMSKIDAAIYAASQAGGMTAVAHTADLTGDGTTDSPLGVAETIARTEDIPSLDGYATTESVTQAIATAIADRLTAGDIKPGNGINVEASGNQVTISYVGGGSSGGLTAVAHDDTLTGDGTNSTPLGVVVGQLLKTPTGYDASTSAVNLDEITDEGVYCIGAMQQVAGKPDDLTIDSAFLLVVPSIYPFLSFVKTQILVTTEYANTSAQIYARTRSGAGWGKWKRFIGDIEFNALSTRVTALEQQVSALTTAAAPGTTGLTAEQLDMQYSDTYNIVRVGTPTHSMETEETSYE